MRRLGIAFALFAVVVSARADDTHVADFALQDYRGKSYSLSDFKDKPAIVLAFLGAECPLAKQYAARLVKLAGEYEPKGVAFLGLNPNSQDSLRRIGAFVRQHEINFPMLKDVGNRVADQLRVDRTPCVVVIDKEHRVRYVGRVDDQFGIGYIKDKPQRQDLRLALEELLDGKPVSVPKTEAVGCLIGRTRSPKPDAAVTYSNQIARLFQDRCVECHRAGEIAPFAIDNHKSAPGWADMILEVVEAGRMPPWHADAKFGQFRNERRLSDAEKRLIRDWVAAGAPEGNRDQLPPHKTYTEGWQLPKAPDAVIGMRPAIRCAG